MITNAFIAFSVYIGNLIISRIPLDAGFPTEVLASAINMGAIVKSWAWLYPVHALFWGLTAVYITKGLVFGWKTLKSFLSHLPQVGGNG